MYVLDTNVISEIRKRTANPAVVGWVGKHDEESLYLTAITIYELKRGILDIPERDAEQARAFDGWLDEVLDTFRGRILPLTTEAALRAAKTNKLTNVELKDCLIGAIADTNTMFVVTRNDRHLARVAERVINPWSEPPD